MTLDKGFVQHGVGIVKSGLLISMLVKLSLFRDRSNNHDANLAYFSHLLRALQAVPSLRNKMPYFALKLALNYIKQARCN